MEGGELSFTPKEKGGGGVLAMLGGPDFYLCQINQGVTFDLGLGFYFTPAHNAPTF